MLGKNLYHRIFKIVCISKGDDKIAQMLIEKGADVNAADEGDGYTPLHLSFKGENNLHMVKLLIEHGANINIESFRDGSSPLDKAIYEQRGNCISIADTCKRS